MWGKEIEEYDDQLCFQLKWIVNLFIIIRKLIIYIWMYWLWNPGYYQSALLIQRTSSYFINHNIPK